MRTASEAYMQEQIARGTAVATDEGIRMEGYAIHGGYFSVPLISKVAYVGNTPGELWQGGCVNRVKLPDDFDYVLSLYPWEKYTLGPDTTRTEVTMYDSLEQAFDQVDELAATVVARLRGGEKVLVHCQAGLNRSGLLAATILVKLGSTPSDAIDTLRKSRGTDQVLCNAAFEAHVRGLA